MRMIIYIVLEVKRKVLKVLLEKYIKQNGIMKKPIWSDLIQMNMMIKIKMII